MGIQCSKSEMKPITTAIWALAACYVGWSDLQLGTNPIQIITGLLSREGTLLMLNIGVGLLTLHVLAMYCSEAYFNWYCAISGAK